MGVPQALPLAVVFGGPSEEHEISIRSARTVVEHLNPARYQVRLVGITREGGWLNAADSERLLRGEEPQSQGGLPQLPADTACVFPVLHGPYGEDGRIQAWFEMLGLPFVGAGSTGSQMAMDKLLTKLVLRGHNVSVPNWTEIRRGCLERDHAAVIERASRHGFPCFVKPNRQGSSVGISKVESADQLEAAIRLALEHDDIALVEQEIVGREFEVAVLEGSSFVVTEPGEIVTQDWYDYQAKYENDSAELVAPIEDLHPANVRRMQQVAEQCFHLLRMRGMARVDFRMLEHQVGYESAGRLYVNEVNSIPGFTSISMYPRLLELAGIGLPHLLEELIQRAMAESAPQVATSRPRSAQN